MTQQDEMPSEPDRMQFDNDYSWQLAITKYVKDLRAHCERLSVELRLLRAAAPSIDRDEKIRALEEAVRQHFQRAESAESENKELALDVAEFKQQNALLTGALGRAQEWAPRALEAESQLAALREELETMRVLAANPHTIQKVKDELGPMSLWTKDGLEREMAVLREEVIEQCARVCETTPVHADMCMEARRNATKDCATNVRALNNADQG